MSARTKGAVLAAAWAKTPELMAALGSLLDGIQSGRFPAAHTVDYAERVLRETERAILAGAGEESTEANGAQ